MIEVVTFAGDKVRDRAEAVDVEHALAAARQLVRDACDAGCASTLLSTSFYLDGEHLQTVKGTL